jgi:hypothetical protein
MRATKLEVAGVTIRERSIVSRALVFTSRMRRSFAQSSGKQSSKLDKTSAPKISSISSADVPKPDPRIWS